jgi:hypothetical protein
MKFIFISLLGKLNIVVFLLAFSAIGFSQQGQNKQDNKGLSLQKRTALEQFESDLVISPEDRMKLKKARVIAIQKRLEIMDTLNISDRQRRKLLKELYRSPFSDEWNKVLAGLEFEEGSH